ncbi:MAG: DegV family protein [Chloroflexi bacterium]|nr:DegV family protein [Chloroflexota bacterium]
MINPIAIVTDSTADIPVELAQSGNIHVVPNVIVMDGESLEDGKDITREAFYQRLPYLKSAPTTATASAGTYEQLYRQLFAQGASYVLSIHASSLLSGIYNAARLAAQAFGGRVRVVDSQFLTLGMGFQVLAAAEAAWGASLDSLVALAEDVRRRANVTAMLDTLEYVRRSGRVSWARARLGEMLHVKPFVEIKNGLVMSLGEGRTRRKGIERLLGLLRGLGDLERLAILHTNAEEDARAMLESVRSFAPQHSLIVNVTTVIGAHAGPNALGFAAVAR